MVFDSQWFLNLTKRWIRTAITLSIVSLLIYATSQFIFRQSANDPQIQMAEDMASSLEQGGDFEEVVDANKIDISKSLRPYTIIYEENGNPLAGSGTLDEELPTLPGGVFEFAKLKGQNRITWQPRPGVRSAIVVVHYDGPETSGFVMAGRSLREIEIRESRLSLLVFLAWLAGLFATLIISAI